MLSLHDLQVIARDPSLPGLVILLDRGQALGLLQQLYPEQGICDLDISYIKYKPHTNCLAGFSARTAHGGSTREPLLISAKAYPEKQYAKEQARYKKMGGAGHEGSPLFFVDAWQLVFWSFPRDRKVSGLSGLDDASARYQFLRDLVPEMPELWPAELETLCYKSERRYVGKLLAQGGARALIKVYEAKDFKNACRAAQTISSFASQDSLSVARPLGISQGKRIIISQWIDGRPLRPQLHDDSGSSNFDGTKRQLQAVGAVLAAFHEEGSGSLAMLSAENEALAVLASANAAALLCPALAARLRRLATRIAAELLVTPLELCPVHGDFSSDQVLVNGVQGERVAIIDYDQARIGDPAADFGSFLAQLLYDEATDSIAAGKAEAMGNALLEGYMDACSGKNKLLRRKLYVAAKLLQLSPQAFRSRHPQWPELMARLLQGATDFWSDHVRRR